MRLFGLFGVILSFSFEALAFEEGVRRQESDAGVHVPVLTKAPELLHSVEAVFPPRALEEGKSASVKLVFVLLEDGTVGDVSVPAPVGDGFDEAAVTALKAFRFTPAEVDGKPAPIQLEYVMHFAWKAPPSDKVEAPPPAPTGTLKGQVSARGSRRRVEGATVRCGVGQESFEALTDEEGKFQMTVREGVCDLSILASGFEVFQTTENLKAFETLEINYHLMPVAIGFETVVRGKKEKKEVVRRSLERQELQKIPGSFGDPVRVLQNFPGVARAPFVSGQLIVRGAAPSQTLTFLDGVEIPLLFHLGGGPSVINAEFLDKIDFYPGGFGARYGRAVGGVVDVSTRQGARDTWHGVAKVDLQDSSLFFETPLAKNVSLAVAARRSYIDALLPLVLPQDMEGGSLLVLPVYADYQVRLDIGRRRQGTDKKANQSFSLMAFGSDDILKLVASGGGLSRRVSLDARTLFHRIVGNWTYSTDKATFSLRPYVGYDTGDVTFGSTTAGANQYAFGLREDLSVEVNPSVVVRTGADIKFERIFARGQVPVLSGTQYVGFPGAEPKTEVQSLNRALSAFDGALYVETDLKAGNLTLSPGLRASSARIYGQNLWATEPRLWLRYQALEALAVKGSLGLYTQPPNPEDLEPVPLGNPALTHEKAFQASLGISQELTDVVTLDLTGYYNRRFENVGSPGPTLQNEDGSITRVPFANNLLGRAYGLEVMLRHGVTKNFFGWVAYTWNRSEERRVGGGDYVVSSFDQTHILTTVGSYRLPYGFEVGARFRYVTGRPTTPLNHQYDLYNFDSNRFSATRGEFRSSRLKDFQQLDIRLDKSWVFQSWTLSAYLDIQNVYNAQNVEATFTDYRFREETDVPGIPFLPILGVRGAF